MQTQLFINGRFVPALSGETLASINPHDNTEIAQVSMAGRADIDRAVDAAKAAFPKWSNTAAADRGRLLLKLADAIEAGNETRRVPFRLRASPLCIIAVCIESRASGVWRSSIMVVRTPHL